MHDPGMLEFGEEPYLALESAAHMLRARVEKKFDRHRHAEGSILRPVYLAAAAATDPRPEFESFVEYLDHSRITETPPSYGEAQDPARKRVSCHRQSRWLDEGPQRGPKALIALVTNEVAAARPHHERIRYPDASNDNGPLA
jgi:hypothetical protein